MGGFQRLCAAPPGAGVGSANGPWRVDPAPSAAAADAAAAASDAPAGRLYVCLCVCGAETPRGCGCGCGAAVGAAVSAPDGVVACAAEESGRRVVYEQTARPEHRCAVTQKHSEQCIGGREV